MTIIQSLSNITLKWMKTEQIDKNRTHNLKKFGRHMQAPPQSLDGPADREIYVPETFALYKSDLLLLLIRFFFTRQAP